MSDTEQPQLVAGRQPADNEEEEEEEEELKVDDEAPLKVAGRLPAVKVGGMRIVQKTHQAKDNSTVDVKDCTGLTPEVNINSEVVSGAPVKGNADFTVEATKVAHGEKAPQNVTSKQPKYHINQPRK